MEVVFLGCRWDNISRDPTGGPDVGENLVFVELHPWASKVPFLFIQSRRKRSWGFGPASAQVPFQVELDPVSIRLVSHCSTV